jgi:signal transduction histidine kinase
MEKLALIGEMSADIAHRIRNPLTIIGGYARRLLKGELSADQRHGLEVILRQSELIGATSGQLLAETDSQHPPRDRWNLGKTLAAALLLHAEKMKTKGIICHFEPPASEIIAVFDLKKISYCLKIIIDRCIDALPAGGGLDIEVLRDETEITVRFSFGGHTVPDEEEAAVTNQPRDIELALVMRMLKQQGGQIVREVHPDGGATYTVVLPNNNKENDHG